MINPILKKIILFLLFFLFISTITAQEKAALFYSGNTARVLNDSAEINDQITYWEFFLLNNKIKYEVIYDEDLESGISEDYSILILPSAQSLSDEQLTSIRNYLNDGGSVFASKNIGAYNENGSYRGWEFIENLFGVKYDSEVSPDDIIEIHTFFGSTHLSANIPAGFRFPLLTDTKLIRTKITSSGSKALGFWYDDSLSYEGKLKRFQTTGIVYGSSGAGKFIWTGFDQRAVGREKLHQEIFNTFLMNSLNWLNNKPAAWIETWPKGIKAAVILSGDVESQFENINNALDIIEKENIKGEFYILTSEMKHESMKRILKNGDIGIHGDNHNIFRWQDYQTQLERLRESIRILEDSTGRDIIAFRPPETEYDDQTIRAIKETGIKILSSDFIEDRSVPQYFKNDKEILVIPKTGYDDYDLFYRLQLKDYVEQAEKYLLDYKRVFEEGGLYTLYYHSQIQCLKDYVGALQVCINQFKADNVWITTANEVYDWWNKREGLSLIIEKNSGKEYSLQLKNNSKLSIENVMLKFSKNDLINGNISIRDKMGNKSDYIFNNEDKTIGILVEEITPYEVRSFTISSENF